MVENKVITQNIANIDTPGYKRKTVKFEQFLSRYQKEGFKGLKTHTRHIDIDGKSNLDNLNAEIAVDNSHLSSRLDGNNVDIESETALMAENAIRYNVLAQNINSGLKRIKTVINEGRR